MKLQIEPHSPELGPAVRAFNQRLTAAGVQFGFRLPEDPALIALPRIGDRRIYQECYLAVEDSDVRGGYSLNRQEVSFKGEIIPVANYVVPISEGTINRQYSLVGLELLKDALRRSPMLFGLGIGGYEKPMAKICSALGWTMRAVPFYFKVENAYRFLREMKRLRRTRLAALAMDVAAISGLGWLGTELSHMVVLVRNGREEFPSVELVDRFGAWADEIWDVCKEKFSMIAVRDSHVLNILYPPSHEQLIRLKVSARGRVLGWTVVSDRKRRKNEYFGNLRVGTIMDCAALPENARHVIRAASRVLEERGVDLIVSNQYHASWCLALKDAGFIRGPSDCIFAASRALAAKLNSIDPGWFGLHVNRDGRPR